MFARSSAQTRLAAVGRQARRPSTPSQSTMAAALAPSSTAKVPILSLPLVPPASRLTCNLLPDTYTPRPDSLLATPDSLPTQVRRSRRVGSGAHFSYVSPLVLNFPYDFPNPDATDSHEEDTAENYASLSEEQRHKRKSARAAEKRMQVIERFMRKYEVDPASLAAESKSVSTTLQGYLAPARAELTFPSARLLGVSSASLQDCLPQLDIGDTLSFIAANSGRDSGPDTYTSGPAAQQVAPGACTAAVQARVQLSEVLSGRLIGARFPSKEHIDENAGAAVEVYRRETAKENAQETEEAAGCAVTTIHGGDASEKQKEGAPSAGGEKELSEEDKLRARLQTLSKRVTEEGAFAGYGPWANCYAGHQFGSWAGQLGDGRAITLSEIDFPSQTAGGGGVANGYGGGVLSMRPRTEIQLKGGGRTPYSRFGDGLATLASSVREYLCSEAMAGLRIPTSRALAVLALHDVTVLRERASVAAVTTRLAPSWLRIGSFQIHASRSDWESVRILGEYFSREILGLEGVGKARDADIDEGVQTERKPWALRLAKEVGRRNAETIARWQVYGFMHGVMNTDNISLLGLTIDYGPFAFMDIFDPNQICNHSDSEGRYTYTKQPSMGAYALNHLTHSLSPIIGFEKEHGRAPFPFELLRAESAQLVKWSQEGARTYEEVEGVYTGTLTSAWKAGWLKRLGISKALPGDEDKVQLIDPLLHLLEDLDFSGTLRNLCSFPAIALLNGSGEEDWKEFVKEGKLFDHKRLPTWQQEAKEDAAVQWLKLYVERLRAEEGQAPVIQANMRNVNPCFVLRNWVTDEVVQRLARDNDTSEPECCDIFRRCVAVSHLTCAQIFTDFLGQVLAMCCDPFKAWNEDHALEGMSQEDAKRLCDIGTPLNGNLPSCSS
ncbi:UPF0061-domain-containing protein [Tilletiaria anomala UBC 951]|uniref:Selenoprotein O n=1 Tax=Tilletiaria anomala (strain ATCC 24038 / CBS 436.72 / UBC 951) TaxID=1037660 RepID=A0A066WIA1_TILAU|nr:UPF0061-domain-containing protein [Tilletiaria anomala UBC 951]KDN53566.1 UPF0061-domain-containing protein [Tilletiaria anomala UBC 951]